MAEILSGLEGVIVHIDDVLVYGKTQEQQDKHELSKETLTCLGYVLGKQGVLSDPEKTSHFRNGGPEGTKEVHGKG